MLSIITPHNRDIYHEDLHDFYRLRKEVFIDQRGWDLKSSDGKEIDQFDHDHAHYLLYKQSKSEKVCAGLRLMPTIYPNLTLDVFSNMIDSKQGFVPSPQIWESSRFIARAPGKKMVNSYISEVTFVLFIGAIEYSLSLNIHSILTMTEIRLEKICRTVHWIPQRLGPVKTVGDVQAVICLLEVSERIRDELREKAGIFKNVFFEQV